MFKIQHPCIRAIISRDEHIDVEGIRAEDSFLRFNFYYVLHARLQPTTINTAAIFFVVSQFRWAERKQSISFRYLDQNLNRTIIWEQKKFGGALLTWLPARVRHYHFVR